MRKVKYVGALPASLPSLGVDVAPGDVIDVPDDFVNANFEDAPTHKAAAVVEGEAKTSSVKESANS